MSDNNTYASSLGRETVNWMATDARVERVARAIATQHMMGGQYVASDGALFDDVPWEGWVKHARAAISAMPEPVGHTSSDLEHG